MSGDTILFWILGTAAVIGALGVVTAAKAVYSALFLAMVMIILAVLYVAQGALFLGVVQVVVYTGAVMMLFLFVLMLVGVDSPESLVETIRGQRVSAILCVSGFGVILLAAVGGLSTSGEHTPTAPAAENNVHDLAALIFTRYLWVFELTSALLITAALGAMVLAHRARSGRRKTQRDLSTERFRPGGRPTGLPNPGVYATHNAVDTPALLPDGSVARASVSRLLHPRAVPVRSGEAERRSHLRLLPPPPEITADWVDHWAADGDRSGVEQT